MNIKKEWAPSKSAPTESSVEEIISKASRKPNAYWVYRNADESIHHIRMRFEHKDGGKSVLPYTYGALNDRDGWYLKAPTEPYPLFNLPQIISQKTAQILIVEGEKAAIAAMDIFPEYIVATTAGGSGAPSKSNLTPLKGRDVTIWPDHDDAGIKYARKLIDLLTKIGASRIRLVEVPDKFPHRWDLADALPEGCKMEFVHELLSQAVDSKPSDDIEPLLTICLSDVSPEEVQWLWEPFIARGNLTMLDGDPGLGKSHVTLAIATALSRNEPLPEQSIASRGTTLLVSCEDSLACSVKPRLIRMNADCNYVFAYPELFTLDLGGQMKLRKTIEEKRPDLVIIDPIFAYMGAGVDTNAANKVRAVLAPLAKIAEEFQCAIVCVRHLSKGTQGQSLMHRGMGSIDFSAAARSSLTVMQHPENEGARVIVHSKTNIGPKGPSIAFAFEEDSFHWLGVSSIRESDFMEQSTSNIQTKANRGSEAENFLKEILDSGPQKSTFIFDQAEATGISKSSLNRAKERLGIVSTKGRGETSGWIWSLPANNANASRPLFYENVENLEYLEELPDIDSHIQHLQDIQDSHDFTPQTHDNHEFFESGGTDQ